MHYYDCPCDECRQVDNSALYKRLITLIERLERELQPPVKEYERALSWLEVVCGGRDALLAMTGAPLRGGVSLPDDPRVAETAGLLRTLAAKHFDEETEVAFLRCLAKVWEIDPGLVLAPVSAAYVAAGVAWCVGEANASVGTDRPMTSSRMKFVLDVPSAPSTYARPLRRALIGMWEWHDPSRLSWPRPELPPFGDPALLTSRTRKELIRVRDRALAAQQVDLAAA